MIGNDTILYFINLKIYKTDLPILHEGKNLECITNGDKQLLIILGLEKEIQIKLKIEGIYDTKKKIRGYKINIDEKTFENFVEYKSGLNRGYIMARGGMFRLPFDRLQITYEDIDGTNATRKLNPLIENPNLRKNYPL